MKTVRNLLRKIIQDVCFLFKYNEIYFIKESYEKMFFLVGNKIHGVVSIVMQFIIFCKKKVLKKDILSKNY